jgi:hypothetical protein
MHTPYAGAAGMLLHINGKFTMGKLKSSLLSVLSLNNSRFGDFVVRIYPIELEIKDTTDTDRSASYLDLHLEINSDDCSERNFSTKVMISIFPL